MTSMFDQEGDQNRLQARSCTPPSWDDTGKPVYNLPVALSIMVFFALCASVPRRSP